MNDEATGAVRPPMTRARPRMSLRRQRHSPITRVMQNIRRARYRRVFAHTAELVLH